MANIDVYIDGDIDEDIDIEQFYDSMYSSKKHIMLTLLTDKNNMCLDEANINEILEDSIILFSKTKHNEKTYIGTISKNELIDIIKKLDL